MRTYPRNSPQAAARLVALALIADGHVCRSELDAVQLAGAEARLGIGPDDLASVLQTFCEDLLLAQSHGGDFTSCLDEPLMEALLREVDDPAVQQAVLGAIAAAVAADGHLSDGEQYVMDTIHRVWRAPSRPPMQQ